MSTPRENDSAPQIFTPPSVHFTQNAANKVWELISEEGDSRLMLRVYISGGGCSGFQYGFSFEDTVNEDDLVVVKSIKHAEKDEEDEGGEGGSQVKLLIDAMSLQYLVGAEIDYVDDLEGERFVIRNPNAKTTCGCGSSFTA